MKKSTLNRYLLWSATSLLVLGSGQLASAQTPLVQLVATNYDGNGNWADSSGNGNAATYAGPTTPGLVSFVTPNGGSAVNFTKGGGSFVLTTALAPGSGYTVFAYLEPTNTSGRHAITGGSAKDALEYDVFNGNQDFLTEYDTDIGHGTATLSTTNFSLLDVAVNSSGGAFRINGASDGNVSGATFTTPITRIGNNEGFGDSLIGLVAEIDIYSGVLTPVQITNIEAQLIAKYVTASTVVIGAASVSPTNVTFAGNPITLSAPIIGAKASTAFRWQTDNGTGGSAFSNIAGATTTNYVLNTTALLGTYEYQLIGTPAGGNSVTSAPVTLTVMPASGPVVVNDIAAYPLTPMVGGNETISAVIQGTLPIRYQWQITSQSDGSGAVNIAGATNSTLVVTNLQPANSGFYYRLQATGPVAPTVADSSWYQLIVNPLTPLVQLVATNYDPVGGGWTDQSGNGNNANYVGTVIPSLNAFVTPNGGAAVNITAGGGSFVLATPLDPSSGYTVFAYLQPTNASGRNAITGGSAKEALEYDIDYISTNTFQDYLTEYDTDMGHGMASIPTTNFSLVDLAVDINGATFRLNGAPDGSAAGSTFGSAITRIGNNEGFGDSLEGLVAEIDIFNGALTPLQVSNIEAQLTARYVTASSVIIGAAAVSPTNVAFAGNPITLSAPIIGAKSTTAFRWQTDNGTGGSSFANIAGATTTNYVLNTAALLGTYEYQLIGTPAGGTSVTSAPVTLTVMPASAPVVLVDTVANPNPATVGGNVTFTASFVGNLPITYQWQVSSSYDGSGAVNIAGATNTTLVVSNLQMANNNYYYSLRANNAIAPNIANSTWVQLTVQALAPVVQLVASAYDPSSGTWTDSSGNGNTASYSGATTPTLVTGATLNGGSAVNITAGGGSFVLTTPLDPSSGYTVFAYVEPAGTGRQAITGGSAKDALEYDIYNGNQDYLTEYDTDKGHGVATIPTSSFSLIDLAVNSSGAAFRIDGAADGNISGATFGSAITRIGNNEGSGDSLVGQVAEIDIYNGALAYQQITNIEAQLMATYGTVSNVATNPTNILATVSGTNLKLTWPADHTGWTLEVQTNALGHGLGTNWVPVAASTTTNAMWVPIIPGNPAVFYRLQH